MKTAHWADIYAKKIIEEKGKKERYTVASGITPSGTVHIGNFREVISVDLVARALGDMGQNVRFIYSGIIMMYLEKYLRICQIKNYLQPI